MPGQSAAQDAKAWRDIRRVKALRLQELQKSAQSQSQRLRQAQDRLQQRQSAVDAARVQVLACLQKRAALARGDSVFSPQSLESLQFALQECRAAEQACMHQRDLAHQDVEQQRLQLLQLQKRLRRAQQQLDQVAERCRALADEHERASEERNDEEAEEAAATRLLQRAFPSWDAGDAVEEQVPRFVPGFGPAVIRQPVIAPSSGNGVGGVNWRLSNGTL